MVNTRSYDPKTAGPALPELSPLPIGALAVGLTNLLGDAAHLPQPRYIALFDPEQISMQFAPAEPSVAAITRWAKKFGGVVITEPHHGKRGSETWCSTKFRYYGVSVQAYARIPAKAAST